MSSKFDLYVHTLETPGYEPLDLMIDWIGDLLHRGYPVWEKVRAWGEFMRTPWAREHHFDTIGIGYYHPSLLYPFEWPGSLNQDLAAVREVTIEYGPLVELPKWICFLLELTKLEIRQSDVMQKMKKPLPPFEIPAELVKCESLNELDLINWEFELKLDSDFCRRSQIQHLLIYSLDKVISPLEDLVLLPQLTHLDIRNMGEQQEHLIPLLSQFKFLTHLSLGSPNLHSIPEEIRSLTVLKSLLIGPASIPDLPSWLADLPVLQSFVLYDTYYRKKPPPVGGGSTDIPAFFRNCSQLLWLELLTPCRFPIRSLYGLPPIAQYFLALKAAYPNRDENYVFNLPPSVYRAIHREILQDRFPSWEFSDEEWKKPILKDITHINLFLTVRELQALACYTDQEHCLICGRMLNLWKCDACHLDYTMAPHLHQSLLVFLSIYYRESIDALFERVKAGVSLLTNERERFLHEIDYHYWQLLMNAGLDHVDVTIRGPLLSKFSVELRTGDHILL